MGKVKSKLTVLFEEPFWIGVFERYEDGKLSAAKAIFGAEPRDYEIQAFLLDHYYSLCFSPAVAAAVKEEKRNPKRKQRNAKRELQDSGIGTKSQKALKLQQEEKKQEHKAKKREQKRMEAERMFELKQQKRKAKHRGR